jgi:carbon-monoxide dehydrogenase large subunit
MDPAEVRRKNLISKFEEAHTTAIGQAYDVGDFEGALDKVLATAGYEQLRAEQKARRESGDVKQLGIGVSVYVEITGGIAPVRRARQDRGQGRRRRRRVHRHVAARSGSCHVVEHARHDQTGIPMDKIDVVWATPTWSRRSRHDGAHARCSRAVLLCTRQQPSSSTRPRSSRLVCSRRTRPDVVLDKDTGRLPRDRHTGRGEDLGRPRRCSEAGTQSCRRLQRAGVLPGAGATFPFGAHVAVVEVDGRDGRGDAHPSRRLRRRRPVLNPMLLEGQIHGGVAQGTAQALLEEVRYDSEGNPITSNLADYGLISAAELPSIEVVHMETARRTSTRWARRESARAARSARRRGASPRCRRREPPRDRHIDMPATAERVWNAIQSAKDLTSATSGMCAGVGAHR